MYFNDDKPCSRYAIDVREQECNCYEIFCKLKPYRQILSRSKGTQCGSPWGMRGRSDKWGAKPQKTIIDSLLTWGTLWASQWPEPCPPGRWTLQLGGAAAALQSVEKVWWVGIEEKKGLQADCLSRQKKQQENMIQCFQYFLAWSVDNHVNSIAETAHDRTE